MVRLEEKSNLKKKTKAKPNCTDLTKGNLYAD